MDPFCTTSMLDYPQHSVEQQNGIARKDHTTLWDWLEFPKGRGFGLKFYPVKQMSARWPTHGRKRPTNEIIPIDKQAVPHNGMKSESQSAYVVPIPITVGDFSFPTSHWLTILFFVSVRNGYFRIQSQADAIHRQIANKHRALDVPFV